MLRGHILLQSDPQWASADPLGACAQCFHSLWVTSVSFLIPCYSRARQSSLSATPGWPVCLSPLLRVISLSDSPLYVITLIFPLAFRNTSHTAPHPQSRISPSECMNPFISPCSATLAEVQPCSAGGQLFQRQPLGLSKTINNRPGQTNNWGNLHRFPDCCTVYCVSWSAALRYTGFLQLMPSPLIYTVCLIPADILLFFVQTAQWGIVIVSFVSYLFIQSVHQATIVRHSQPSTKQFPDL